MHELSIALSVLDIVRTAAAESGLASVTIVRLRVGRASGVQPDSLRFAFDCSKAGTPAEGALLEIDEVPEEFREMFASGDITWGESEKPKP